jgi:hypothetical protein
MSDEAPETYDDFPPPLHFVLTPVKDGAYHKGLPTVTAVYLNCEKWPDGTFLMGMLGVSLDPHDTEATKLILHMFIQPEDEEQAEQDSRMEVFSDTCGFELSSEVKTLTEFLEGVRKIKAFTLAVSTEEYYFCCRVDAESTAVTEVKCDWRYLN